MSSLERIAARGILVIPDAHVAATPPGHRLPGYREQVMAKLRACLDHAREHDLHPLFAGDLFHWPRENPNDLLVELIELFAPQRPSVLVGNHDKHLARFTPEVSLAVLAAAGAIRLLDAPGPAFWLETPPGPVLAGASPDATPLPRAVDRDGAVETVWFTHHNIGFPDFRELALSPREIPGLDWLINGHIHRPQPQVRVGGTRWCNPGNITRLTFSARTKARVPAASVWLPGADDLEPWPVPLEPFEKVFPDQPFPQEQVQDPQAGRSRFLAGLERLAWRRTQEGLGLKEFLSVNLGPEHPETDLIWQLYEEVAGGKRP